MHYSVTDETEQIHKVTKCYLLFFVGGRRVSLQGRKHFRNLYFICNISIAKYNLGQWLLDAVYWNICMNNFLIYLQQMTILVYTDSCAIVRHILKYTFKTPVF